MSDDENEELTLEGFATALKRYRKAHKKNLAAVQVNLDNLQGRFDALEHSVSGLLNAGLITGTLLRTYRQAPAASRRASHFDTAR